MPRSLIALAFIVLLAACSAPSSALPGPTPTPTPLPATARSVAPSQYVFADCIQGANIYTWQDLDRDGLPDPDEPPLSGISVELRGWWSGKWTTDERGKAQSYAITSCPIPDLEAIAELPPGYTPTTPLRVSVAAPINTVPLRFGFAKDSP